MKKKIAFVNFSPLVYDVSTPYEKPLGGSESAMCYLAEQLAKRGHDVILFTALDKPSKKRGVKNVPIKDITTNVKGLDIFVVENSPFHGYQLKLILDPKTKLILWTQHDADQKAVEPLSSFEVKTAFDYFILLSDYQLENYVKTFGLERKKCTILRNAISPLFENLKLPKKRKPILVYTSTPFRGLDLLIQTFPPIKAMVPEAELRVYSSLGVYHVDKKTDEASYGALYDACRRTPGVKYIGSVPQKRLAKELKEASVFAYPNTFPETGCIAAMEAMASGLYVVTSNLGVLPETTHGFGKLINVDGDWQRYGNEFIAEIVKFLRKPKVLEKEVDYINKTTTWKVRAREFEKWIRTLKS